MATTEVTGEEELAAFLSIVAAIERGAPGGFMTAVGLVTEGKGGVESATTDGGAIDNAACLNSTDFKFPRVVMTGPFLPGV